MVKPGDVVIVFEQGRKRGEWKTGVVTGLIESKDKVVRGAKVCVMKKGRRQVLCRPCEHLYPVEMRNVDEVKDVCGRDMDVVEEKAVGVEKRIKGVLLWTHVGRRGRCLTRERVKRGRVLDLL